MDRCAAVRFLAWCTGVNFVILWAWAGFFIFGHDLMYRMHTRWFKLDPERFDALHYLTMGVYKSLVLVFNVVPLLVLWLAF
jgi:hypothetical protein